MRERVLRDFFEKKATAAELAQDVAGAISQKTEKMSVVSIEDMNGEFTVTTPMLVRYVTLCWEENLNRRLSTALDSH